MDEWFKDEWRFARAEDKEFRDDVRLRLGAIETWIESEKTTRGVLAKQRRTYGAIAGGVLAAISGVIVPLLLK